MIGLANYLKVYSATYFHYNRLTLSGIMNMCATSPRIIRIALCAKPNRQIFNAIT